MSQNFFNTTPSNIFFAVFVPVLIVVGCVKYAERNNGRVGVMKNDSVAVIDHIDIPTDTVSCSKIKLTAIEFTNCEHKYIMFTDENGRQVVGIIHSPNCSCKENK